MESWSYISRGEEDFVHNESVSATNGNGGNENWLMGADVFMSLNQEGTKNTQFVELGYAEKMAQTSDKPLIDLKLGRFPDNNSNNNNKDVQGNVNANPNFSSAESSIIPAKRIRAGKSANQIPYCQVYGCKKDLSNCKDYHKRHKVCEIHSKTAKVIVNGIDQRFCQQCSRFHLLSEFDEGKRSCRRRLAGHNERRRKPHIGMHSSRAGRLFQPYNGTRFNGSCFAFPSRHPSTNHLAQKYEIKDIYTDDPQHGISYQMCSNTETHSNNNASFLLHNNSNQEFDSHSLFPIEELTIFDSLQTCQTLPSSSSSSCALSLLSFQSENPQNIPITTCQTRSMKMRMNTQTTASAISNAISADETHMEPVLISNGIGSDKYGINEFFPSSSVIELRDNNKNPSSNGDVSTINLLRLSSQLQQVEDQRRYMHVKQEDTFFGLRIT